MKMIGKVISYLTATALIAQTLAQTASESHMALILTNQFLTSTENLFLSAFIKELDELQMGDLTIKQKTEHSRLSAQMQSVKLSSYDFQNSKVVPKFDAKGRTDLLECSQADDDLLIVTISNFTLDFQFQHWFEVSSSSIESE
jgi:hypothetical protein